MKLPANWSLSAISHSFIELQILPAEASINQLQMQFKKAVEDHREGHAIGSALAGRYHRSQRSLHEGVGGGEGGRQEEWYSVEGNE